METKTSGKRHLAIKVKKSIKLDSAVWVKNEHDEGLKRQN
jgi:hypothetical protein